MPNNLAIVIEKLEHYQFVNSEFSVKAHLIDTRTNGPRTGEKLQLKVLLMFEELPTDATTYKEYHPNLIEVIKNEGIQAEDGMADIRVKLKEVSMAHDDRRFVICLQAYQSGAGNNLISAHSNPVTCIRHKLIVFEDPNSKNKLLINDDGQGGYMWYKDEGAKDKCIEMVVQLVDCHNNLVVDRIVPLNVSLTYSSGQLVHPQNVLLMFPERNIFIGNSGYEIIRFRVNEVSRNHRKQNFQIFVSPDISNSPVCGDISPACSVDFEVKSKRTADARNKTQSGQQQTLYQVPAYGANDYNPTSGYHQKIDDDYSHYASGSGSSASSAAVVDASPYVYVKSDFSSNGGSAVDAFAGSKRKLASDIAMSSVPVSSSSVPVSNTGNNTSSYTGSSGLATYQIHHHSLDAAPSVGLSNGSSNSLLSVSAGEDLAYYPIAAPSSGSSSAAASTALSVSNAGASKSIPVMQYAPYGAGIKMPTAKYPRLEDNVSNVDHHVWNEQCSGQAVESVREIDAWSKLVLQLVDDLLSGKQSPTASSVLDTAVKIKVKFATDVVSSLGCLNSYTSYQHQYNCNHSKLLQTLQYQFPGGPVTSVAPSGGLSVAYGGASYPLYAATYSTAAGPSSLPGYLSTAISNSSNSSGASGPSSAVSFSGSGLTTNYQSVVSSQMVLPSDEAVIQAILVMKSVVVQLHDELDSTTDVGVPAFDSSYNLVGFYKANENFMLFRKSDKLEPLLSELQKSQIKSELVDALKTKSKFLFDLTAFSNLAEMKNAALAAIIAKAKAEKDLIDAVSLMENLRKPYMG